MFEIPESMVASAAQQLCRRLVERGILKEGDSIFMDKVADTVTVSTVSGLKVEFTFGDLVESHQPLVELIEERLKACLPKS